MSGFGGPPGNMFGSNNPAGFGSTPPGNINNNNAAFGGIAPFGSHPAPNTTTSAPLFGGGNNFFGSVVPNNAINAAASPFDGGGVAMSGGFGNPPATLFGTNNNSTTMSSAFGGFGSPFGTAAASAIPSASTGFVASQQQQQQPSFPPTGFGNSFGQTNTNPNAFGSPTSNINTLIGLGSATTPTTITPGFGSTNADGFGSSNTNSGSFSGFPSIGFGSTATSPPMASNAGFGSNTSSNFPGFGSGATSSGFGTSAPAGFGSSAAVGFGTSSASATAPFGATAQQQQPGLFGSSSVAQPVQTGMFGSSSTTTTPQSIPSFGGTGFSSSNPGGFGTFPSTTNSFGPTGNTFGNSAPGAPLSSTGLSFGSSSNIVARSNQGSFASNTPFPVHSTQEALPAFPYGASSFANSNASHSFLPSDNEDMDGDAGMSSASNSPFASPLHPMSSMAEASATTLSPIQETMGDAEDEAAMSPVPNEDDARLATLKAKMQAKKKRLEELKRRKEASSHGSSVLPDASAAEGVTAALALPTDQSLAERNVLRFAKASAEAGGAPPSSYVDFSDPSRDDREDLENAVSLVGTCDQMCPEDELLRRQREGDIQLLELPQPGTIHPEGWTIRDTAVKRFRRSAADYKLDVPEWIRPPDVLERVCGYLEEWVMERDRQGADPRFPQVNFPPSLDVYQFVWDRTRMIRKDFILQNYVGTGGNCDARAVRCHERIARWHAMCEHQLSHIPEFATMQSQQNIQELGQTMKTLNQFYDDSLSRSLIEVPDDDGNETRSNLNGFSHGCSSDIVMGKTPTDYDGTALKNTAIEASLSQRLLGKQAVNSASHGTAEPEMRGLYILLTINNEGGMEVLKYAARLFRERPEIYHSQPVQLALNIYKAKKEYNYARFFSILRDPTTPYLFACIMFKHVELMRKIAFRIMSKTFGARRKDNGEAMYDEYQLKSLQRLLCFEDIEEARQACQHYNITVKQIKVKSPKSPAGYIVVDFVFWRLSEFREPTDPEKGTTIILRPRKMIQTIESKLKGMTRLAVCRGEASGVLTTTQPVPTQIQQQEEDDVVQIEDNNAEEARLSAIQAIEEKQRLEAEQQRKEDERRQKQEQERLERQRREQLLARKREEEEERRQLMILQKQSEEERAKKLADEEEKRRIEAAKRAAEENLIRQEAEQKRLAAEREAEMLRAKEEENKRLRQAAVRLEQERLEKERLEKARERQLEEERKHKEAEIKRLALQRQQEEENERRREEARRAAEAWEREVMQHVKQFSIWLRWRPLMRRHYAKTVLSKRSLRAVYPGVSSAKSKIGEAIFQAISTKTNLGSQGMDVSRRAPDARSVLEHLLMEATEPFNIAALMRQEIHPGCALLNEVLPAFSGIQESRKITILLKVVVILPSTQALNNERMCSLVRSWIDSRVALKKIWIDDSAHESLRQLEVRALVANGSSSKVFHGCDIALFVIPPPWSTLELLDDIAEMSDRVNGAVRRAALVLPDDEYMNNKRISSNVDEYLSNALADSEGKQARVFSPVAFEGVEFDRILFNSLRALLQMYANDEQHVNPRMLDAMPISKVCISCISESLWSDQLLDARFEGHQVLARARASVKEMVTSLKDLERNHSVAPWSHWPAREFAEGSSYVKDYFGIDRPLPISWNELLLRKFVEPAVVGLFDDMKGQFVTVLDKLTAGAPFELSQEFDDMLEKRQLRRSLQQALMWWRQSQPDNEYLVYLPCGMLELVVDEVLKSLYDADVEQGKVTTFDRVAQPEYVEIEIINDDNTIRQRDADQEDADRLFTPIHSSELRGAPNTKDRSETGKRPYCDPYKVGKSGRESDLKRPKTESSNGCDLKYSGELEKSRAFTKKLENYARGQTVDMTVGETTLAEILRDAPSVQDLLMGNASRRTNAEAI